MIKIENTEIVGWEAAIRGMRNPKNSWNKSDSIFVEDGEYHDIAGNSGPYYGSDDKDIEIGPNDHKLMMTLSSGGPVHGKYRRFIDVYVDITAPLYWWKEFDTYRLVCDNPMDIEMNSCSTMHTIHQKEFTLDDFSHEHLFEFDEAYDLGCVIEDVDGLDIAPDYILNNTIRMLNKCRELYLETKDKRCWWQMIQLLPTSYMQKRTLKLNYEVLAGMWEYRKDHKQDEWNMRFTGSLCDWIKSLPYSEIITGEVE